MCLFLHVKGYHIFCDWEKTDQCDHKTEYINHCRGCGTGMIETLKEPWADDGGKLVRNKFLQP